MSMPDPVASKYDTARIYDRGHRRRVRHYYVQFVEGLDFLVELGAGGFAAEAATNVGRVLSVGGDPGSTGPQGSEGSETVLNEILDYLATTDDKPNAVIATNLIEHLQVDRTLELLVAIRGVLQPGGLAIMATPNPASLAMMLDGFWNDPANLRPYPLALLKLLFEEAGFEVRTADANPLDTPGPPPGLVLPATVGPWGSLGPTMPPPYPVPDDMGPDRDPVVEEARRLRDGMDAIASTVDSLVDRLEQTRHQVHLLTDSLNMLLHRLYGPSEIFVIGERPA